MRIIRRFVIALGQIVACLLGLLLLVCAMVVVQSQRDEVRSAGLALVVDAGRGPEDGIALAELDYAIDLQRRGVIERIVLPGDAKASESQRYLISRGAPAALVVISDAAPVLRERLAHSIAAARTLGASRILVVAQPSGLLRILKMARDQGMDAYGAPVKLSSRGRTILDMTRDTVRESWAYLGYVLGGG